MGNVVRHILLIIRRQLKATSNGSMHDVLLKSVSSISLDSSLGPLPPAPAPKGQQKDKKKGQGAGGAGASNAGLTPPLASGGAGAEAAAAAVSPVVGSTESDKTKKEDLRQEVIATITEFMAEISEDIAVSAETAQDVVHNSEVILTFGSSNTVCQFLEVAATKRKFEVIVAESAPKYLGHTVAKRLAAAGISVTFIADSAVFAVMSRVSKVIVGTHAVLADGGLIAPAGMATVAQVQDGTMFSSFSSDHYCCYY